MPLCKSKSFINLLKECDKVYRYLYGRINPPLGYFTSFPHETHKDMAARHTSVLEEIHPRTWYLQHRLDPFDAIEVVVMLKGESKFVKSSAGKIVYSTIERNTQWLLR